jgi:hypothetical protein
MAYTESLVREHLRRIPVNDYEFGTESDKKTQTIHIINTVLTHLHSAIQFSLESNDNFDTLYGERTVGDAKTWIMLQTLLQSLADDNQIDLKTHQEKLTNISNYFYNK